VPRVERTRRRAAAADGGSRRADRNGDGAAGANGAAAGPPAYRIGQAAALLGVSPDTVRRWADTGRVKVTRTEGGRRLIDGVDLARFAAELGTSELESLLISDVSVRNQFRGIVTKVTKNDIVAQVELQSGPHRIVSIITREACDALRLTPGVLATAAVAAANVLIEVPATL
jgi:molybdopterin-binding protein